MTGRGQNKPPAFFFREKRFSVSDLYFFYGKAMMDSERTQPYATIVSVVGGFVSGTLLTGLVYASRYIVKLKAARMRLIKTRHIIAEQVVRQAISRENICGCLWRWA